MTTTTPDAYLGLDDYFQLEGLAYRLVPIKWGRGQDGQPKAVNTSVMYDNLMNKFDFDVSNPHIYINEDNERMASTFRNAYAQLARALADENKMDSAVRVCDRVMSIIPNSAVPLNYFNAAIGEVYFKAGAIEKGTELFKQLLAVQEEQMDYYFTFPDQMRPNIHFDIEQCLATLHAMIRIAGNTGQKDLQKEMQGKMDLYYSLYTGSQYHP